MQQQAVEWETSGIVIGGDYDKT